MDNYIKEENHHFKQFEHRKRPKMMFAPEDDAKIWRFIAENYRNYGPFEIFTKMKEVMRFEQVDKSLYYRFRNVLAPNLHLADFDVDTKMQVAKKFNLILNEGFVQSVSNSIHLERGENGCIEDFFWKNGFSVNSASMSSSQMLISLAAKSEESRTRKRRSVAPKTNPNEFKNFRNYSSESFEPTSSTYSEAPPFPTDSFFDSLKEMITETVETSNRDLIKRLKVSNEALVEKATRSRRPKSTTENPGLKHYLQGFRELLDHLNTPELEDIRKRVDLIDGSLGDSDKPLPLASIRSMLDTGLKLIGG